MVKLTGNDRSRIQHLEKRLREALDKNFYHPPAGASENDYRSYQQKVIIYLRSINTHENNINAFLSETDRLYSGIFPSEIDTEWYRNDPRASLWLVCELYEELKKNKVEHNADFLSPELLQPSHNVRVDAMRRCINDWPLFFTTQNDFIKDRGIEWANLLDGHDLFRDVRSSKVDVGSWLKDYLKNNTSIGLNRICGESPEEVMAWCYTSYFIWRKNNLHLPVQLSCLTGNLRARGQPRKTETRRKLS